MRVETECSGMTEWLGKGEINPLVVGKTNHTKSTAEEPSPGRRDRGSLTARQVAIRPSSKRDIL